MLLCVIGSAASGALYLLTSSAIWLGVPQILSWYGDPYSQHPLIKHSLPRQADLHDDHPDDAAGVGLHVDGHRHALDTRPRPPIPRTLHRSPLALFI